MIFDDQTLLAVKNDAIAALALPSGSPPVAVLCCAPNSIYRKMSGVECYDQKRDVRTFAGGMPVVAHPPCRSWSAFTAHQAKPQPGEKDLGPLCADWLRKCGGVLEHPAHSRLFDYCGLPKPGHKSRRDLWTMEVWQAWWGYPMRKQTWLCFSGIAPPDVPQYPFVLHAHGGDRRREQLMSKHQRSATPPALAEWLVRTAALVNTPSQTTQPATPENLNPMRKPESPNGLSVIAGEPPIL